MSSIKIPCVCFINCLNTVKILKKYDNLKSNSIGNPRNLQQGHGFDVHSNSEAAQCRNDRSLCPVLTYSAEHFTSSSWHKKSASCTVSNSGPHVKIGSLALFHTKLSKAPVPGIQSHFTVALACSSS